MDAKLKHLASEEFRLENVTPEKVKVTLNAYGYQGEDLARYITLLLHCAYVTGFTEGEAVQEVSAPEEAEVQPRKSPIRFKQVSYVEGTRKSK